MDVRRADLDHDGEAEFVLADSRAFYVFENDGGRLVFAAVRDPQTGVAEPFLGTLLNAPGNTLSRDHEGGDEDSVTRAPGLVDWWSTGWSRTLVNDVYAVEARPQGWRFRLGGVEKEVSLRDGKLQVRYRCDASVGDLYVRTGLSPASLDLFVGGATIDASLRSDGAVVTSAPRAAGGRVEVALLPQQGARRIANAAFGGKGARGVPFSYQVELTGSGSFGFQIEPSLR